MSASVQLAKDGKVIRVHPVRRGRSRELGAFANPHSRARRKNSAIGYTAQLPLVELTGGMARIPTRSGEPRNVGRIEVAATDREPDNTSGKGGTSGQSPAAGGSVAVAAPPADAMDAGGIQLPVWTKVLGWCGTAGLIYLLICAVSIISAGFAGLGSDAAHSMTRYQAYQAQLAGHIIHLGPPSAT